MIPHSEENLINLRCSAVGLLAFTVHELFPNVLLVGGDYTDIGFFYDFIFEQPLHDQALTLIEVRMRALIKQGIEIRSLSMMRENGHSFFMHHQQPILAERSLQEEQNIISLIQIEGFYDLCSSTPLASTAEIGSIKLLDFKEVNRLLPQDGENVLTSVTRLIGTAFDNPISLKKFTKSLDQLKKRDHRILGSELDLFSFNEKAGNIECFWHPKGEILRDLILNFWKKSCQQIQAQFVKTPLIIKKSFVKQQRSLTSMTIEEDRYVLSASHFFHHLQLFLRKPVSVSELPVRFAECVQEYQDQDEAKIWGLLRTYSYSSDQMTIFCSEDQVMVELISSLQFFAKIVRIFGFEDQWYLVVLGRENSKSKREAKAVEWLKQALDHCQLSYLFETQRAMNFKEPGIELRLVDSLGRSWRGPSIEVMTHSLERLNLFYQEADGQQKVPVILTKTLFGSLDRFIALLVEKSEGVLPRWLAPEQVRVLAIGSQNQAYAQTVYRDCLRQGCRVTVDVRSNKLGMKIHEAEKEKIPYLLIVGDKEEDKKLVTVRTFEQKNKIHAISLERFFERFHTECGFPS